MFRNHLHPVVVFSSIALSLGVFCLSIAGQILYDQVWDRYGYDGPSYSLEHWSQAELIAFFMLLGIGSFILTGSLGLIFKKNWARYMMQVGFIIAALGWLAFVSEELDNISNAPILMIGITTAVLGCVIGALLFLNNADWALPYFHKGVVHDAKKEVLDQGLWD